MIVEKVITAMEKGWLPDTAIRMGIRRLCRQRLDSLNQGSLELNQKEASHYVAALKSSALAVHTREANEQHYEVPAEFFELVLGRHRKYSSGYWTDDCRDLSDAEELALTVSIARAEIVDGMQILELGCGWGSLTLAMASRFPNSKIVALSNSASQRESIENRAESRGLKNIHVITRNIAEVDNLAQEFGHFDRVVSIEMFEHLRNYELLFKKVSDWLKPSGKLFTHVFSHKSFSYFFDTEGEDNWMGKYFFTGGQMPAHELFAHFQRDLTLEQQWAWDGTHYARTSEAWLDNMDQNHDQIMGIFRSVYGEQASVWFQRWRVFFMSCAELFNYDQGREWGVSHYLFSKKDLRS
jgi:cyclopropane-fatty-acyl-phospholipid synthase